MTYMIAAPIFLSTCLLVACTQIFIRPYPDQDGNGPTALNVQTTDSVNVLGSQNVVSQDKAARGSATDHGGTDQRAEATPTVVVPITSPIGSTGVK